MLKGNLVHSVFQHCMSHSMDFTSGRIHEGVTQAVEDAQYELHALQSDGDELAK